MYWTCEHCGSEMEHKYDYCTTCESAGCTLNNHKCVEDAKFDWKAQGLPPTQDLPSTYYNGA